MFVFAAGVAAAVVFALVVVIAESIRVVVQFAVKESDYAFVSTSCNSRIKFNACLAQGSSCSAAYSAADKNVGTV